MALQRRHDADVPNHDVEIWAIFIVFSVLSLITLSLRLMSRRIKHLSYYYDDYLAIAAWVDTEGTACYADN